MSASAPAKISKLYYSFGSCSTAVAIVARHLGLNFEVEAVDLQTHKTKKGVDFYTINDKGNVPALFFTDGSSLNEGATILELLSDLKADKNLLPEVGNRDRYLALNELNFVATELHTGVGGLFGLKTAQGEEAKQRIFDNVNKKLSTLEKKLGKTNGKNLALNRFTPADAYAYVVLSWTKFVNFDISPYKLVKAYFDHWAADPLVTETYKHLQADPSHVL